MKKEIQHQCQKCGRIFVSEMQEPTCRFCGSQMLNVTEQPDDEKSEKL